MLFRDFREISSAGDLLLEIFTLLFGFDENMTGTGLGHGLLLCERSVA